MKLVAEQRKEWHVLINGTKTICNNKTEAKMFVKLHKTKHTKKWEFKMEEKYATRTT